jgi:hypothetical protein
MTTALTTSNQEKLLSEPHLLSTLPQRFQDSVKIARWMQIDYIWVDALCIIQDSKEGM